MNSFKDYNRHTLSYVRVFEHECKVFLRGACCADHAWTVIEMLRRHRSEVRKPLLSILDEGSIALFAGVSHDQIITAIGKVRNMRVTAAMVPEHMKISGSHVHKLMEKYGDITIVSKILYAERQKAAQASARTAAIMPSFNISPGVRPNGNHVFHCADPGQQH